MKMDMGMCAAWIDGLPKQIRVDRFDVGTFTQHTGIDGFRKWDGVLILYHGLITETKKAMFV